MGEIIPRMKFKDRLQQKHEILDALASKDKEELKKASYVAYDDVIEFPQPVAFTIKSLKKIITQVEKTKPKDGNLVVGMMLEIPIPEELRKTFPNRKTVFKITTVRRKYDRLK